MRVNRSGSWLVSLSVIVSTLLALTLPLGSPTDAKEREEVRKADKHEKADGSRCDHLPPAVAAALKQLDKRCPDAGSSSGIARGDFNGDGFADLAVGVPREETPAGVTRAGAVVVIYGSAAGLTVTDASVPGPQFWSQNTPGVPGASEIGDTFGSALASGDFNNDDFSDLAIGVPGDAVVKNGVGSIGRTVVIYGSANGLTTTDQTVPAAQSFVICDVPMTGTLAVNCQFAAAVESDIARNGNFGAALAWGDFDGDGFGDLAIGSPTEMLGNVNTGIALIDGAGAVAILFGSADGLSATRGQFWTQSAGGPGPARAGDRFGSALAGGDFNDDRISDLAIGIPRRDVPGTDTQGGGTIQNAGAVLMLLGREDVGLTTTGRRFFDETFLFTATGIGALSATDDLFGSSLAVGDFDGDGRHDLAIGAHNRPVRGRAAAGAVWVQYSNAGVLIGRVQFWEQSGIFPGATSTSELSAVGSPTESADHFGWALAAGDFNADGRTDLAIGVPFETILVARSNNVFEQVTNAGEVDVIYGAAQGLSITDTRGPQRFTRNSVVVRSGDLYGFSLSAWNFGRNEVRRICGVLPTSCFNLVIGIADLAIGVPGQDVGTAGDAGAVRVFYGSGAGNGLVASTEQIWTQTATGAGASQAGDFFGAALY